MPQHKISLTYGDPSADGHGISETDYYLSSHSARQIVAAVSSIERHHSFSFDDFCCEYGDTHLTEDQYDLLLSIGILPGAYCDHDYDNYVEDFTGLYLAIARLALPDLVVTPTNLDYDNIDIGGYGMCSAG